MENAKVRYESTYSAYISELNGLDMVARVSSDRGWLWTSLNMRKRTLKNRRKVLSMSQTRIEDIGGRQVMEDYVNLSRFR
jgi:hypothetical protein